MNAFAFLSQIVVEVGIVDGESFQEVAPIQGYRPGKRFEAPVCHEGFKESDIDLNQICIECYEVAVND